MEFYGDMEEGIIYLIEDGEKILIGYTSEYVRGLIDELSIYRRMKGEM